MVLSGTGSRGTAQNKAPALAGIAPKALCVLSVESLAASREATRGERVSERGREMLHGRGNGRRLDVCVCLYACVHCLPAGDVLYCILWICTIGKDLDMTT